jgi:hypothetical protein
MKEPRTFKRELMRQLATPVAIIVLDRILHHVAAHTGAVASVFAAGPHVPPEKLLLTVGFLGLHFVVVAFIPGFIISRTLYAALRISGAGGPVIGSFGSLRERHWSSGKRAASAVAEPTA